MSGFFHENKWYENADLKCCKCGYPVYESYSPEYPYQCFHCNEGLYGFEVEEQDASYFPKVLVARPAHGITVNEDLEYLMDETGKAAQVFAGQPDAEAWLTAMGCSAEELEHFYFVEYYDEPPKRGK